MDSALQKNLKHYLETTGLSVAALERKAGLKLNVARNILRGQSKKPSADNLQAISSVMGCTVQDLLGVKGEPLKDDPKDSPIVERPDLLNEALAAVLQAAQDGGYALTLRQTFLILEEVYSYAVKKDAPGVDKDFVQWFVGRTAG